jgi:hypothetical protein
MAKQTSGWAAGLGGKKPDLEAAKAWYSSPEYQQWLQASARATGGGITGFDPARMNAPMEIRKKYDERIAAEKKAAQAQAPAAPAPTPTPAPAQNDLVLGKYPKVPSPTLPPLPQGTVTLPSMAGGTLTLPQMPQGGLTMPPPMQMQTMNGFGMNNAGAAPAPAAPAPAPASAPSAPADPAVAAGAPNTGWDAQVQHSGLNMQSIQDAIRNRMSDARARAQTPEGRADMMKSAVDMMKPQQVTPSPMLGTLPDPFAS